MKKEYKKKPIMERLLKYVKIPITVDGQNDLNLCWIWNGCKNNAGYGLLRISTDMHMATVHRIMYIETYKTINYGDDVEIQHKCGNKLCVNPHHLQQGDIASRFVLQKKYHAYNKMFSDRSKMYLTCEYCGKTDRLPHFKRLHKDCNDK